MRLGRVGWQRATNTMEAVELWAGGVELERRLARPTLDGATAPSARPLQSRRHLRRLRVPLVADLGQASPVCARLSLPRWRPAASKQRVCFHR